MKVKLYTVKGESKTEVTLPKEYDVKTSKAILTQAVKVYEDRTHFGLARVKTRSEVNISRRKIYKQKGTGGARHGAKSAHIFVGGGVAHGPKGEKRNLNMPSKMKKVALYLALSNKFKSKNAFLVDGLGKIVKTSEANKIIDSLKKAFEIKSKVVIVLSKENYKFAKYYKNIKDVTIVDFLSLNAFNVLMSNKMFIDGAVYKEVNKKAK